MNHRLGIVGASTRAAAASAVRAGFQPLAADLFADADLRRIATATRISPYPEGFVDWLRSIEPPAWMYTGALENHPELVDQMAWIAPLWGNPGDVLAHVRSPWELSKVLAAAGLLFPETRATADGLPRDGTWLAKTYQGASGSGVREFGETRRQGDKETGRQTGVDVAPGSPCLPLSLSPCLVYQRRIAGTPCAVVYVASGGAAQLLGVTRQLIGEPWLGAHGFQYAGSIGPWPISEATHATLMRLGNVLTERFELVGLFGVDFILEGDEVWMLEVNPRYTASVEIVERFTGVNAVAAHAEACGVVRTENQRAGRRAPPASGGRAPAGGRPSAADGARDPAREKIDACAKAIIFARTEIVVSEQFAEWSIAEASREPWPTLGDVSRAGTLIEAGRPVLTVFAEADRPETVEDRLRERVTEIEQLIYRTGS